MPKAGPLTLVLTCEHAGAKIPKGLAAYFFGHADVLKTHRASDLGALPIAKALAKSFSCALFFTETSRLVVDCNRSLHHKGIISPFLNDLTKDERERLVRTLYLPYREKVESHIRTLIKKGRRVLHISVHSFTPELNGQVRDADIGLLFDPSRSLEKKLCLSWQDILRRFGPEWQIRRNYPYRGTADGFTTSLRRRFSASSYAGIEVELNQAIVGSHVSKAPPETVKLLRDSLSNLLHSQK